MERCAAEHIRGIYVSAALQQQLHQDWVPRLQARRAIGWWTVKRSQLGRGAQMPDW